MDFLTRWLVTRRDTAADRWCDSLAAGNETPRLRRSLKLWDFLLDTWTNNGTR